jgi:hypothetical protein
MKTKSNNIPSKLQSEAVKKLKERFIAPPDSDIGWIVRSDINPIFLETVTNKTLKKKLEQFLSDQIQKAYSKGREEVLKEKDIAEKFLYSNLPLDLSIGTEFEVGGRYEDWGFVVNYKGNKISEGGTLEQAINNAKTKLSIQSKEK